LSFDEFSNVSMRRAWIRRGSRSAHCPPPRKETAPAWSLAMIYSASRVWIAVGSETTIWPLTAPPNRAPARGADRS
jgi:hypothetical protein